MPMKKSLARWGLIGFLLLVILATGLIFFNRILPGDAFTKEEAQHALYGYWLVRDVQTLNWHGFWYDTNRQMVWPFLHSWFQAVFFLIFGIGYVSARALSLVLFLSTLYLMYSLSIRLGDKLGHRIGLVSVALALTSPLMIRFASENMLEALGAFLFLASANYYMICEEKKAPLYYALLGLLVGMSIYTNYLYAYLMIPPLLVATLSKLGPISVKAIKLAKKGEEAAIHFIWWAYNKMIVLFVLLILAGVWFSFSFSRKILLFFAAIFKYSGGTQLQSITDNLIYYPRIIVGYSNFSPWLGLFILLSLFLPFVAKRYLGLNKLFTYVWTVLLLLAITITTKAPQLIVIVVPFILIIFASMLLFFYERLRKKDPIVARAVIIILMVPMIFSLPRLWLHYFPDRSAENMRHVLVYIEKTAPREASLVSPLNLQHFNPEALQFHFRGRTNPVITDTQLTEAELLLGEKYFLTVDFDTMSVRRREIVDDSLYRWNGWLKEKEKSGQVVLFSAKRFDSMGITAKIYKLSSL